jgi:hypothetical protein
MAKKYTEEERASFKKSMKNLNHGGLHNALHIPVDETIPVERIKTAANSKIKHVAKMAQLALDMRKWK